jgi:hypothetical protein
MSQHQASAQPEKRLFISLITRDISLADAVLDLIDNSINSAIIAQRKKLQSPKDYIKLLELKPGNDISEINVRLSEKEFFIADTCGGIPMKLAEDQVFRFGRAQSSEEKSSGDTLSVYGIGLKRAVFKMGDHVQITSAHPDGGFFMDMHVHKWERLEQNQWSIPIEDYSKPRNEPYGTRIQISKLYPDISNRIADGKFKGELASRIARTYNYFLERVVRVKINGEKVEPIDIAFGANTASEIFSSGGVAAAVMAGISVPKGKFHVADTAGWYVFCNGRAVAFADKTAITGWGTFLPSFQPKHRPFLGLVFFTSENPELLPWTTTKSSINQESAVWQHALRVMGTVGKQITGFLDKRYSDDGTEISKDELLEAAGKAVSAFEAVSTQKRQFKPAQAKRELTSVQFAVKKSEIDKVKVYLGRRTMSNTEVGRHTFDYFLENIVGK